MEHTVISPFLAKLIIIIDTLQMMGFSIHPSLPFIWNNTLMTYVRSSIKYFQVISWLKKARFSAPRVLDGVHVLHSADYLRDNDINERFHTLHLPLNNAQKGQRSRLPEDKEHGHPPPQLLHPHTAYNPRIEFFPSFFYSKILQELSPLEAN